MADIVDRATRSKLMSGIRGKDTKPEIVVRKALFARGFRYRLHSKTIPGKPDMVFPKLNAVIFINGCFWHSHDCHLFKMPSSNKSFWENKFRLNRKRDEKVRNLLIDLEWRILTIWECSFRGRGNIGLDEVIHIASNWLKSSNKHLEIRGEK